jgi:fructoselysine 6-kinase
VRNVEGERVFQGASNGVVAFDPSAADYEFMAGAALIHSGDSSFMGEHLERFAAIAPLSFDFSIKPTEYCSPILPHVSYATFSRPEMDPAQVPDFIDWAHSRGAKYVLVTKGMAGSWVSDRTRIHHEPAVPTQVLDTLGAGDSFIAAMLMSLLRGESLAESAAFAAQFAAQSCRGYGAFGYEAAAAEMTLAADHRYE